MRFKLFFALAPCLVACLAALQERSAESVIPPGFEETLVASVPIPTALAATPDGRLLIASQLGQLYVYQGGLLVTTPVLDLGREICTNRERGLLGVAVDPGFENNGFIYVSYTFNRVGGAGGCAEDGAQFPVGRVSRFRLAPDNTVDRATGQILIDNVPSPVGVHNLNDVRFGKDGYLYVSIGDGGCDYAGDSGCFESNDAARDMHALLGKVLRIAPDGGIPPDNPFVGPDSVRCNTTGGAEVGSICQEIFATGLRNPWRLAFDPNAAATRFFINDVGAATWEEINNGQPGADYGWNIREGLCVNGSMIDCSPTPPPGLTNPLFVYDHNDGCASITGGAFVPEGAWPAEFDGVYLFSDYVCGGIFKLVPGDGAYSREPFVTGLAGPTGLYFADDGSGAALYYTTFDNGGEVRRLSYTGDVNRKPTAAAVATPSFGAAPLAVDFDGSGSTDADGEELSYEWDFGDGTPSARGPVVRHSYTEDGNYVARLTVSDPAGATGTAEIRIDVGNTPPTPIIVGPTVDHRFSVGENIVLTGRGDDAEDGELGGAALTWRVLLRHGTHLHPFLPPTTGSSVVITAPPPESLEAAAVSYLELELTATDSKGRTSTVAQQLLPRTTELHFASEPPGATLHIDDADVTAPVTFTSWVNFEVQVAAADHLSASGVPLEFVSWSDGGPAAHRIVTPASPATFTATFTPQPAESVPMVPGRIEAEDFAQGAAGVAYFDLTPGNAGGVYRASDVDIAEASDDGGGYTVGWVVAGEWLKYVVSVKESGTYDVLVRVANTDVGGKFHIELDEVDSTGPIAVPSTGDWQLWTTVRRADVALTAGTHVLRLVMDTNSVRGAVGNFNWIEVVPADGMPPPGGSTPFSGTPLPLPGRVEAENFDIGRDGVAYFDESAGNEGGTYRDTDVDIAVAEDVGGGCTVGWVAAGEWLNYTVGVASSGTYDIDVRVASLGPGGTFRIQVDDVDLAGTWTVPDTGGWQSWATVRKAAVLLESGVHVLRLVMESTGPGGAVGNFNWIEITPMGSPGPPPEPPPASGSTPYGGVPAALPGRLEAENFDDGGADVAYFDRSQGNEGGAYRTTDVDVAPTDDAGVGYTVGWVGPGEWLKYTVSVPATAAYDLDVRLASLGAGGTFHVEVDDVDVTGPIAVPDTGDWQAWVTVRTTINLAAGVQVWRVVMDTAGASGAVGNLDWFQVASREPR